MVTSLRSERDIVLNIEVEILLWMFTRAFRGPARAVTWQPCLPIQLRRQGIPITTLFRLGLTSVFVARMVIVSRLVMSYITI
jgi:hypothetical protein